MQADWLLLVIALGLCGLLVYELQSKRAIVRGADRWTVDWVRYKYRPGMYIFSIALQILVMVLSFVTFIKTF